MKLDPAFKVEKACSRDESRPVLTAAYLDSESSVLVATENSYCLAVVPVEVEEGDVSGLIPAAAFSAWRKASTRHVTALFSANGSVDVRGPDSSSSFPRPEGQYPDWQRLVARPENEAPEVGPIAEFGIDAALLLRLAEALGTDRNHKHVRVKVYSPLKPIRVESTITDAYGIVMPIRLS